MFLQMQKWFIETPIYELFFTLILEKVLFIWIRLDKKMVWPRTYIFISATLLTARPHRCTWCVCVSNNISFVLPDEEKMPHLQEMEFLFWKFWYTTRSIFSKLAPNCVTIVKAYDFQFFGGTFPKNNWTYPISFMINGLFANLNVSFCYFRDRIVWINARRFMTQVSSFENKCWPGFWLFMQLLN